jgi:pimeloyl-ACP methyl ester carboxylesterase
MSAIILDNEFVHYEVLGRGRPILFLHGWVGSWRYWIPAMQSVSTDYRSYAIDFWGFGDSAKEPGRYLLSKQRDLLGSFMFELGIRKIAIIGHGLGAVIGLMFADQFPTLVDRLMAISFPLETSLINPRLLQSTPGDLADWLLGNNPETQAARSEVPKTDQDAVLRTINNLGSIELAQLPNRLTNPCLLVNGLNDPAITLPPQERLDSLPPNLHHISFNQSGHFPMLDQPNKFNRLMFDFLTLESGQSPTKLQLKDEWKRRIR